MTILLIEDEAPAARRLRNLVTELRPDVELIGPLDSIEATVQYLEGNPAPQLALMDIELADGQSFEIFKRTPVTFPVVFTTAYDDFALQAFKVNSIDYLLKPVGREELEAALSKFEQLHTPAPNEGQIDIDRLLKQLNQREPEFKTRFLVRVGQKMIPVGIQDSAWFHSEEKLTFLHTYDGRRYPVDFTLDELDRTLNPTRYFRANRQFILAIDTVVNVHMHFNGKLKVDMKPKPAEEVIVSREKAAEFKAWLDR